jgi:hypothetical protein
LGAELIHGRRAIENEKILTVCIDGAQSLRIPNQ